MSDVKKLLLFGTPVIIDELDEAAEINAELSKSIDERRTVDQGVVRSNAGGWHSKRDFTHWSGEAGRKLLLRVLTLARDHTMAAGGGPPPEWSAEAWANVSTAGAWNKPHVHGGAFWSGVYYVRAPESDSGQLVLHDPRMPALRMYAPGLLFKGAGAEQIARIRPTTGMVVMFPSWLLHSVEPWDGEGERISIAFNIFANARAPARAGGGAVPATAEVKPKSKSKSKE
jgi:uncharacterized protein (TIGR02466 family)